MSLDNAIEFEKTWNDLKAVISALDIHILDALSNLPSELLTPQPTGHTIKGLLKCTYPKKDVKFSVVYRLPGKENKAAFIECNLKAGESGVFKKIVDKIKKTIMKKSAPENHEEVPKDPVEKEGKLEE